MTENPSFFEKDGIQAGIYLSFHKDVCSNEAVTTVPFIYLVCDHGEGPGAAKYLETLAASSYILVTVSVPDWNRDLSPWEAPAVFKNAPSFSGGASDYLDLLIKNIVPEAERRNSFAPSCRILAGYSLAGLFAVWAAYQTDLFERLGSASGSMWFPGFEEYAVTTPFKGKPTAIYFSLGDREARTKNPVMKTVEEKTSRISEAMTSRGVLSVFELNPGNHFVDGDLRTAKACAWLLDTPHKALQ